MQGKGRWMWVCAALMCPMHETAVAWIRKWLHTSLPRPPMKGTQAQYSKRCFGTWSLPSTAGMTSMGLCKGLPGHLDELKSCHGDRLIS